MTRAQTAARADTLPLSSATGIAVTRNPPHVRSHASSQRLQLWYVLATLPLLAAAALAVEAPARWLLNWLPVLAASLLAGYLWERVFSRQRSRPYDPSWLTAAWLLALLLPAATPLWLAALAASFGLIFGHYIFGGLGRNLVSPALLGALFVNFSYPGIADPPDFDALPAQASWASIALAHPGAALAGASAAACAMAALLLVRVGAASARTLLGTLIGAAATAGLFNLLGTGNEVAQLPWYWHLVLGNLAFGAVFLATDPSTGALTRPGRWAHGVLAGSLTVLIRVLDPASPDGALFAILLAGLAVPLADYLVVRLHTARRHKKGSRHGG
jgi:Na+-transporting NADH:ubiquinone oxidoreductase subunit B